MLTSRQKKWLNAHGGRTEEGSVHYDDEGRPYVMMMMRSGKLGRVYVPKEEQLIDRW